MRVNLPSKLGALRSVSGAQLKAMYDAIVAVLNGHVAGDNFARAGGIPNVRKIATKAWMVLEGELYRPLQGTGSYGVTGALSFGPNRFRWKVPANPPAARKTVLSAAYWSFQYGCTYGIPETVVITAGTVELLHTPAGGVEAQKATFNMAGGKEYGFFHAAVGPFDVNPGDVLEVKIRDVAYQLGVTDIKTASAAVWLKTVHVP